MMRWFRRFLSHETTPLLQFVKYAMVGGMATAVNIGIFYLCAIFFFPCLTSNDVVVRVLGLEVEAVPAAARAWRAIYCNGVAFFFSNGFCYALNRLFVFKPGRHHRWIEFLLFFAVSGFSLLLGTAVQTGLIAHYNIQTTLAFSVNLVTSLLINYAMRRFVIFKG